MAGRRDGRLMEDTMEKTITVDQEARRHQINKDCRDGYLYLEEFERAFKWAFVHNPLLEKACEPMMERLREAHMRLMDRCPVLCGQDMDVVERCQCCLCTMDDECDPFVDEVAQ